MKSFFALATVFALAIVPLVVADPVSKNSTATLDSKFVPGFSAQVPKFLGIFPPFAGSDVIIGTPGNFSSSSVWFFINGTNEVGHIELRDKGFRSTALCVSSRKANGDPAHVATVEECNDGDIYQDWTVSEANPTVISQGNQCLTMQSKDTDKVVIIKCSEDEPGRLWNAVPVKSAD